MRAVPAPTGSGVAGRTVRALNTRPATFSGAVLTGGRSTRMGRDKAFVLCAGRPMADIARTALLEAGASEVLSVGGDRRRLAQLGFVAIADETAGTGPLGGLLTALRAAGDDWVAVLSCDLPWASAATVRELLAYADEATDVVVPLLAGRRQSTYAVWRRSCHTEVHAVFAAGERRMSAALDAVRVREVTVRHPASLGDADTPADLPPTDSPPGAAKDPP